MRLLIGRVLVTTNVVRAAPVPRGRSQRVAALRTSRKAEPPLNAAGNLLRGLLVRGLAGRRHRQWLPTTFPLARGVQQ
jgi:hypothetical protein